MRRDFRSGGIIWGVALATALLPSWLCACSIPVFRYALERWSPDPYRVEVLHRGPLSAEARAAADLLAGYASDEGMPVQANIAYRLVDVGEEAAKTDHISAELSYPLLVVYFPESVPARRPVWVVPFTPDAVKRLVDSPVRSRIVKQIVDGDAAVWILLESGNRQKDDTVASTLRARLDALQTDLSLPDEGLEPQPDSASPAKPSFSMLRVSQTDPAEEFLVRNLLRSEPDLASSDEPLVFPVYGRGRALYALVGKGINADIIREASTFLCGACSCQVKAQNPGTDLLIAADWWGLLEGSEFIEEKTLPPLSGAGDLVAPESAERPGTDETGGEAVDRPPHKEPSTPGGGVTRTTVATLVVVFVAVLGLTWVRIRRRP